MNNLSVMFSSNDMTWETPIGLFNKLNNEFGFTVDVCAGHFTAKCPKYYTEQDDELSKDWSNDICWMNPPYGKDIYLWMKKTYEESLKGATVVALIPSRTDTVYWQEFCMKATEIRFIKGRLKFGDSQNSAPFPSAIIIFSPKDPNQPVKISSYDRGYITIMNHTLHTIMKRIE